MNTVEITKMSLVEKLQAMDAIWDSLIHDNLDVKSPEWHGDILSARKKKIEEGKAEFCSIEELGNYYWDSLLSDIESLIIFAGIHPKNLGIIECFQSVFPMQLL